MLKSKHRLEDLGLFEELDDQVSEKISGGVEILAIQISGLDNISEQIKSSFSADLAERLEEVVPDIANKNSLSLVCVDNNCQGVVDEIKLDFTLK